MTKNDQKIRVFRERIPSFSCTPGCHDCCGPVTASSDEVARLPTKSDEEHDQALSEFNCPYLGENGCEVYQERPLICRLFGTTASLPCPNGCGPSEMTDPKIERQIHTFHKTTRQVLL
ncbi:YkgJ family cysteine cluster protein [Motiliproteus sp. MSK22-1]|uniref:YkgJ family cysteine cluster protein n=1 Tax=Motiliproteus sp. MSK22-1 TaxID=1897630 RepID=UPI0009777CF1|nr:YkgJ family cysteine cluster protein [Motiliproteus sp. MSK22-1]